MAPTQEEKDKGIKRMEEIKEELLKLLSESEDIIIELSGRHSMIHERATAYWLAHATSAITEESRWVGGSMVNMEKTIKELQNVKVEETEADDEKSDDEA